MTEEALLFGTTRSLVGILTDPPEAERGRHLPVVVLLNAGLVHRVGPHRLYVKIARHLAAMGFVVLRFDFSGIGDSNVREDHVPFKKSAISETQEAMQCLRAARGIHRFVLMGLCSGAAIALQAACCDPHVVGAVLINAQGLSGEKSDIYIRKLNAARYYWNSAVFNPRSWLRVIKGKTDYRNIIRTIGFQLRSLCARKTSASSEVNAAADFRLLTERGVSLFFLYDEWDPGLDYFHEVLGDKLSELKASGKLRVEILQQANHTFTLLGSQAHLLQVIQNWADAMVEDPHYEAKT